MSDGSTRTTARPPARLVRFTPSAALLVTAGVFIAFVLRNAFVAAHQIVGWIVACALVALLIDPVVNLLDRRLPRVLSVVVVIVTMVAVVVGIIAGLARELLASLDDLEEAAPRAARGLEERYAWAADVDVTTRVADLVERINEAMRSETIDRAFGRLPTFLVTGVLMLFLLAFGRRYVLGMLGLFDDLERRRAVRRVLFLGARRGRTYILFTLAHSLINGLIFGIACWLLDLPAPVSLGFAVAVMTAIPLIGTIIGGVPALLLGVRLEHVAGGRHRARPARHVAGRRGARRATLRRLTFGAGRHDGGACRRPCCLRPVWRRRRGVCRRPRGDRTRRAGCLWGEPRRGVRRFQPRALVSPVVKPARRIAVVVAAGCVVATGCANDGPTSVQAGQPSESTASTVSTGSVEDSVATGSVEDSVAPTQTVTVQAIDNTFRPDRIEVAPGTEVVWVNRGRNDHDLFADLGFGVTAAEFKPGDEYRHVFTEPGEYPYYCTIHGTPDVGMTGTVVVTDAAGQSPPPRVSNP